MRVLLTTLTTIFLVSLILDLINNYNVKTAVKTVKEMGIGYNLGNLFDSYNFSKEIKTPDEQITLWGNSLPTKKMISNIKKYGFKTIRFPVTWMHFIDEYGNVNSEWMSRVKEVVNWIVKKNLYCVLNIQNDAEKGGWLYDGISAKNKYINLWRQIAEEFKHYNEYLVFESINKFSLLSMYNLNYAYEILFNLTQSFVDIIRNSGGYNLNRLLIISGMDGLLTYTCSPYYKLPIDSSNKLAISIHYETPIPFTKSIKDSSWGSETQYKTIIHEFDIIKDYYINKGIPIIFPEIGVLTEINKQLIAIREYLYFIFSISIDYGVMPFLWDTSNKKVGDMNYYNRETNEWYDQKLSEIFLNISKDEYIRVFDFYYKTNIEIITEASYSGDYFVALKNLKPLKIIINGNLYGTLFDDYDFSVSSKSSDGEFFDIQFGPENGKKQYDGTIIYTFDVSNYDCTTYIEVIKWFPDEMTFNNLTIEYNESFSSFNYKKFKSSISNEII